MRIGCGIDVHAFGEGDHVMLGGVRIPHSRGVTGHSDADVALHALVDAILGALAEGDTPMPVLAMIAKVPVIKGHNIWLTTGDETRRKAAVEFVLKGLESGALKPVIDRAFKFDDMVEVHRYLESNGQFGKIVVTV